MVRTQVAARGVRDAAVLDALERVERHLFVPSGCRDRAYGDYPLPIGPGQTISQPYIVGLMTQLLEPKPDDRVLEIGTGSGYQAAVLAEIVAQVYSVEIDEHLAHAAERLLLDLNYENIRIRVGDGYRGWPEEAPFDSVIVTAAPSRPPQPLIDQLRVGGRLVIPVGGDYDQRLRVIEKKRHGTATVNSIAVRFVPMVGEARQHPEVH
ncbi:protein-L-isoaspartate(D-aspartate) O-methyltransferase [Candidatus Sumerlaeota bacterium]|nr:protein-L-isoaspartate(D-aspartate) O-methyltransferase [Candidatus Sumerlaeota bacterium]